MSGIYIHPKAIVEEGASIGEGTRVWAFAHVMSGAKIGTNCNIGNYAFVEKGAVLGNNVTVKNGVQVWEGIIAEDGVFFGPNCVLTNDYWPRSFLKRDKSSWLRETKIETGVTIGANSVIRPGTTLGKFSFIGAGAVVVNDVAEHALMVGNPARVIGWLSKDCTKFTTQEEAIKYDQT